MKVYHGTSQRRAEQIAVDGFAPRAPTRRVWFAQSKSYALRRAKVQARRRHDRPALLTCELDIARLREQLGRKRVICRGGIVVINGPLPVSVLRHAPGLWDLPASEPELAAWLNRLLGLKPQRGMSHRDPGVIRLARWVQNRRASQPRSRLKESEIVERAAGWLPEWFRGVSVDPSTLRIRRRPSEIEVRPELEVAEPEGDPAAVDALTSDNPRRRMRGLQLLGRTGDPDLIDWCALLLSDPEAMVRRKALELVAHSDDGDPELLMPFATCRHQGIRAIAVAGLARHGGDQAAQWCARGLHDPDDAVRVATAGQLPHYDPQRHRQLFELALYDPNPSVVTLARKLTAHQGYHLMRPQWS